MVEKWPKVDDEKKNNEEKKTMKKKKTPSNRESLTEWPGWLTNKLDDDDHQCVTNVIIKILLQSTNISIPFNNNNSWMCHTVS